MPEDKDFKRIVRARMAETGERYTAARAGLRPEATAAAAAATEPMGIADVVPMDLAALEAWRRDRPLPVPGRQPSSFGPHWELTVDAGGELGVLVPPGLDIAGVAALGAALGGVAYVSFGLHVLLPAPEDSDPDDLRWPGMPTRHSVLAPLSAAHAELHGRLREHLGVDVGGSPELTIGRLRRQDADIVLPGRSGTTVLLGRGGTADGLGDRLDPSRWPSLPGGVPGRPWAAYGVVLHIERDFPTRQFPIEPPPGFTGQYQVGPMVDETFWTTTGDAFRAAAAGLGLPPWPLHLGKLDDPASRTGMRRSWQQPV
jgi:hypothetical protein